MQREKSRAESWRAASSRAASCRAEQSGLTHRNVRGLGVELLVQGPAEQLHEAVRAGVVVDRAVGDGWEKEEVGKNIPRASPACGTP